MGQLPPFYPTAGCDVVITGVGMTTPVGMDTASSWAALLAGASNIHLLTDEWAQELPVRIAGKVAADPAEILSRVQMRRLDRAAQYALVASRQAWADAACPDVAPERFAVVMGTGIGGVQTLLSQYQVLRAKGPNRLSPFAVPMLMPNASAAVVSLDLGARGGAHAPMSACASGAEAIAVGLGLLRSGRADIVLAGGTDACVAELPMGGFARMGALSSRQDDPDSASRPFDTGRDGFVIAEGAGAVVLERAADARARGAKRYATVAGAGLTSDAHDMTTPSVEGQVRAIHEALDTSGLAADDIGFVSAHATGTPVGDVTEVTAVMQALGSHPVLTATKSVTGHLIGGAGAINAVFTALTVRDDLIPPTKNLVELDPEVKLEVVTGEPRAMNVDAAIANSFGFGGHNVVLAFTKAA
jgi:3-oxoacyl-[acyl-carrier-protein] synthase II